MKTIYLDHNILIYLFEKNETENQTALEQLLEDSEVKFVFSLWNLIEITGGGNNTQSLKLARFVDETLNPLWILDRKNIQEEEINAFLKQNYFKVNNKEWKPVKKYLSEVLYYLNPVEVPLQCTAEELVRAWCLYPDSLSEINQVKNITPQFLATLQEANKRDVVTKEIKNKVDQHFFKIRLPDKDPSGKRLTKEDKEKALRFLIQRKGEVLKNCPAIAIEDKLSEFRVSNPNRVPEPQDAIDLQHAVPPLGYCDFFVTNDRYLRNGAEYVKKHYKNCNINICVSLKEVCKLIYTNIG